MGLKDISGYTIVVICILLSCCIESGISKIAYNNKSIEGKVKSLNEIQEEFDKTTISTITTGTTTELGVITTGSTLNVIPVEDKTQFDQDFSSTTPINANKDIPSTPINANKDIPSSSSSWTTPVSTTEIYEATTTTTLDTDDSSENLSCTCGIFLNSQFIKGSADPPKGEPVISNILDRNFPCNPIGQKQCQTKCLEQIVQHLPNSAKILCASLQRNIYKERAYLFIKNCGKQWHNTNLAAGREYCCKNGQPYKCSIK